MSRDVDQRPHLSYASPLAKATRPSFCAEVGCLSSVVGAAGSGVAAAWAAARFGFEYDGAPSLVGRAVLVLLALGIGATVGAIVAPAVTVVSRSARGTLLAMRPRVHVGSALLLSLLAAGCSAADRRADFLNWPASWEHAGAPEDDDLLDARFEAGSKTPRWRRHEEADIARAIEIAEESDPLSPFDRDDIRWISRDEVVVLAAPDATPVSAVVYRYVLGESATVGPCTGGTSSRSRAAN